MFSMKLSERYKQWLFESRWTLGFIEATAKDILDGVPYVVHYLKGMPKNRWFADPFILNIDELNIYLLVEDYSYSTKKGIISKLTVDRSTYMLKVREPLLDIPTHLSFPAILRLPDGSIIIYPENSESGKCTKYTYDVRTNTCKCVGTVMDEPLTDAIVNRFFGDELIFSTHLPVSNANGNILSVYTTEGQLMQQCIFDSNIARNGGDWFKVGDKIYRPAQDCNEGYGRAVILQEVIRKDVFFSFRNIRRLKSTHPLYNMGMHTFNSYSGVTVIDMKGYRHHLIVKAIEMKNSLKWRIQRKFKILLRK